MGPVLAGIIDRFGCPKWLLKLRHFYADNQLMPGRSLDLKIWPKNCPLAAGLFPSNFDVSLYS